MEEFLQSLKKLDQIRPAATSIQPAFDLPQENRL